MIKIAALFDASSISLLEFLSLGVKSWMSSSWTILTMTCPGERLKETSLPRALTLSLSRKSPGGYVSSPLKTLMEIASTFTATEPTIESPSLFPARSSTRILVWCRRPIPTSGC